MMKILYIHGMGGGADSRIPRILAEALAPAAEIIIRTYDFDPEKGAAQIAAWVEEEHPGLVIGESLGAIQAMRVCGVPHLYVSPSLGAPARLGLLAGPALIPGVPRLLGRIWQPREGDRQVLDFRPCILRKYPAHFRKARENMPLYNPAADPAFAFFGTRDHYRRSGVVSLRAWQKYFGEGTFTLYDGTHFMEEEYIRTLLIPKIQTYL